MTVMQRSDLGVRPKGHLQPMKDAGINLVSTSLDSCLRRNDG